MSEMLQTETISFNNGSRASSTDHQRTALVLVSVDADHGLGGVLGAGSANAGRHTLDHEAADSVARGGCA